MNKEQKTVIIVFLIALGLRLILFLEIGPWKDEVLNKRIFIGDAYSYHTIAANLVENNGFSSELSFPYLPNIFRTPVYPSFLA